MPHEDAAENRRFYNQWIAAYPSRDPIVRGFVQQAVLAQLEKRRIERGRAAVRAERVRTAVLYYERDQEDEVIRCTYEASDCVADAMRHMLRSAAGCRWAIDHWEKLNKKLTDDGTWYGIDRVYAIQLQGLSACLDELFSSEEAYMTWLDCLVAQPKPKQEDIDLILDRRHVPKSIQDRDRKLWPGDPVASRRGSRRSWTASCRGSRRWRRPSASSTRSPRGRGQGAGPGSDHEGGDGAAACRTDARAVVCPGREGPSKCPQADGPAVPEVPEIVVRGKWIVDRGEGTEDPGRRSDVVFPMPRAPGGDL